MSPLRQAFRALLCELDTIAVQGFDARGRITLWNPASEQLYGWSADEALGQSLESLILAGPARDEFLRLLGLWQASSLRSWPGFEIDARHRDGSPRPVLSILVRHEEPGQPTEHYCLDIDLRTQRDAEHDLRIARERLVLALQGSNDGIWDWDIARGTIYYSTRFRELLGYADESTFRQHFEFRPALHADDLPRTAQLLDAHLHGGGPPFDCDYRLRCAGGQYRWFHGRGRAQFDASGKPQRFAGAIMDIDARVEAEQALRASEDRLRLLVELSADWYWATDAELRFTELSGGPRLQANASPAYLGKRRWELPSVGVSDEQWRAHRELHERREPFRDFELRRTDEHGRLRVYQTSGRPRFDEQGHFLGYVGVGRDITELSEARDRERHLQQQLQDSQKLEALGTLAGGIAHDFNNILGAQMATLAMARQDAAAGRPVDAALAQLESTSARARALVQQILAFSRRQAPQLCALALQPLLREVLTMLRATVPARIELVLAPGSEDLYTQADASQMHQVLVNLVINAVQSIGAGSGCVRLVPGDCVADGREWVVVDVIDDGPGMSDETRRRAFEPFFTTKAPGEGTGLGLSVAHGVVSAHGGHIELTSLAGRGTRVRVLLPRLPREAADAGLPSTPTAIETPVAQRGQVLLVDDDEVVRLVCAELMRRDGQTVTVVAQAADALSAVRADAGRFDLVVTDYNMPAVSGVQLAEALHGLAPALPVVLVSGYLDEAGRARALRAGVVAFVDKQHLAEQLLPSVQRALAQGARAPRQPPAAAAPA